MLLLEAQHSALGRSKMVPETLSSDAAEAKSARQDSALSDPASHTSSGSSGGGVREVLTAQKRHPRVQVSPINMMVAVAL